MKKNSGKAPSFQMYPKDWNEDTALKLCSFGAEGLWIRLINTSYDMPVKGLFSRKLNGGLVPLKLEEILSLVRGNMREKKRLFNESLDYEIIKQFKDGDCVGAFYCKRLYQDMKMSTITFLARLPQT